MKNISLADYEIGFDDSLQSLKDFLSSGNYSSIFVLVDENTKRQCLPVLENVITAFTVIGSMGKCDASHASVGTSSIYVPPSASVKVCQCISSRISVRVKFSYP